MAAVYVPRNTLLSIDSNTRAIVISIGFIVFAISQFFSPPKKITFHSVDAWWIILIIYTGLSTFWALNGGYAIYGMFMTILFYGCYSVYQYTELKSEENINYIFWVAFSSFLFLLLLLAGTLINFIAADNLSGIAKSRYANIIFQNSNVIISILLLLAPYVAFTDKKLHKAFIPVVFIVTSIVVFTIQPMKAVLVLSFIALIYLLFNAKLNQINKYLILGFSIGILIFGLVYAPINKIALACKTKYTKEVVDQKERIKLWSNSMDQAKASPIFGHGKNNWELEIGKYGYIDKELGIPTIYPKSFKHSYNVVSQLFLELGIIGIIAFLYIAILPCFRLINERSILAKLEVAALVSVTIFFLLGLFYGEPLTYFKSLQGPSIMAIIGLSIISSNSNQSTVLFTIPSKIQSLVLLLGAVLSIIYFSRINHAENLQAQAITANFNRDYLTSEKLATSALAIIPESKSYHILFQSLLLQQKNEDANRIIVEAFVRDPYDLAILYLYGEQFLKVEDFKNARLISNKIQKIAPQYLYGKILEGKCDLLEKPTSANYQKLIQIKNDLHNFSNPESQEEFVSPLLYPGNVLVEISRFLNDHKSKVYKHIQ